METASNNLQNCPQCQFTTPWDFSLKEHEICHHSNQLGQDLCNCTNNSWCPLLGFSTEFEINYNYFSSSQSEFENFPYKEIDLQELSEFLLGAQSFDKNNENQPVECEKPQNLHLESGTAEKIRIDEKKVKDDVTDVNVKWFHCAQCSYKSKTKKLLKRHLLSRHTAAEETDLFYCDQCPYNTKIRTDLNRHIKAHHTRDIKIYNCNQCSYKTKNKFSLKAHSVTHCGAEKFSCDLCTFTTIYKKNYERHRLVAHAPQGAINWFNCAQCSFKTKFERNLKTHAIAVHSAPHEIKWLSCAQCSYKTQTGQRLEAHVNECHGLKWFDCDICSYATRYEGGLKIHVTRVHNDEINVEWFACDQCSFKTKKEFRLKTHVHNMHTSDEKINWLCCEHCDFRTKISYSLRYHVGRLHPGIVSK